MTLRTLLCFVLLWIGFSLPAQIPHPVNGVPDIRQTLYVLTGGVLHPEPGKTLKGMQVWIRGNTIEKIVPEGPVPAEAVAISCKGRHLYPSFIECNSSYGLAAMRDKNPRGAERSERDDSGPLYWNMAIHPETEAASQFDGNAKEADRLRKMGIGICAVQLNDGIARGTGALVSTASLPKHETLLRNRAFQGFSLHKGSSVQEYPSSLAGSVALLRQSFLDAEAYPLPASKPYSNLSLEAYKTHRSLPAFFETRDAQDALLALEIGSEFGYPFIIQGSGDEYTQLDQLKGRTTGLVLPLNFPEALDVSDAYEAENLPLSYLLHWEAAPANPALMFRNRIPFALSTKGCDDAETFFLNLRKAIAAGLPLTEAERALTETPARWLGIDQMAGALKPGLLANILVCSDSLGSAAMNITEHWVQGQRYTDENKNTLDLRGSYWGTWNGDSLGFSIRSAKAQGEAEVMYRGQNKKAKYQVAGLRVEIRWGEGAEACYLSAQLDTSAGKVQLSGWGRNTQTTAWDARLIALLEKAPANPETWTVRHADSLQLRYPMTGFGWLERPKHQTVLFEHATVWTNEAEGVLNDASVLIRDGKIVAVGTADQVRGMVQARDKEGLVLTNLNGKHLSPGIIDEHSHIALRRGVNEGTQNNTAEVRMGDALNAEDVDIYRQLAGGVTCAQLLHGSANPIGGQSALIKLRWGGSAAELRLEQAPKHIKFALGENVKQSNWGDFKTTRFPQTRMGVEQVYYDAFQRAKEYMAAQDAAKKGGKNSPMPARNLELEALAEILRGERHITCHSYVQSEINMLMHVADSMGFKVNTFTHILEGYKVADKIKAHGANASSFSDWWAYKWEVNDAIPYNGSLLNAMGVNTGFNSDDAEMARRLNQEAAKAVLYGGTPEAEALKFVTLNPARMLKIDQRTGSIKVGKDADLVVWSDHPLSVRAVAEQTWVDGKLYYSTESDSLLMERNRLDRQRILQHMQKANAQGKNGKKLRARNHHYYTCEDLYHEEEQHVTE